MKIFMVFGVLLLCAFSHGASATLQELKMQKRFGVGVSAAGPLSIMGLEIDVNLTEEVGVGLGFGTGIDYSTFMAKGRYYLMGKWVSPYLAVGVANWWSSQRPSGDLKPSILTSKFLDPNQDLSNGFSLWMIYPAFGVQFMSAMGLAFYAEMQYLVKMFSFANNLYAGVGVHWYF